ncbi:hypothetical protein, partial [Escherichia coli]|uniref:hypothetical protein n=1 Tax=Escherichia coli TaxID=562 RepID=UPI0028DD934C
KFSRTTIQAQLEYSPFNARPMVASAWMVVTIADVRFGPNDLTEELNDQRAFVMRSIEQFRADSDAALAMFADSVLQNTGEMHSIRTEVAARF